jgi:hypothetical protein
MNLSEEVVVGWSEALEEGEVLKLEDLVSKIGGEPVISDFMIVMAHR